MLAWCSCAALFVKLLTWLKPKTPGRAGRLVSGDDSKSLRRLNLETGFFDGLHDLSSRELVGVDG